jgi:adenylyltransferase/sulfurtransferase
MDAWAHRTVRVPLAGTAREECPCCGARRFDFLDERTDARTAVLCGRNAVQVLPAAGARAAAGPGAGAGAVRAIDLAALAGRLAPHGAFEVREGLLVGGLREIRARDGAPLELTVFTDGRAIVRGSTDEDLALTVYDRLVGS